MNKNEWTITVKNILFINKQNVRIRKKRQIHIDKNTSSGKPPSETGFGKHRLSPINR